MDCFDILKIERTNDKKVIRHAYAELVKHYHMETHPKEFEQIKEAYNQAMAYAKHTDSFEDDIFETTTIEDTEGSEKISSNENVDDIHTDEELPERIFFETALEEAYSNVCMAQLQELEGLQKIKQDFENHTTGGYQYFKDYVLTPEFLKYQYDKYYIKMIADLFMKYANEFHNNQLVDMFLPFGIMYGLFSEENHAYSYDEIMELNPILGAERNGDYIDSDDMIPIIEFAKRYIDFEMLKSRFKKEDVQIFLIVARKYRLVAVGYKTNYYIPDLSHWQRALNYMDYEVYPQVMIKNDYSIWMMIEQLILNHPDIDLEIFLALEEMFHMADAEHTSKKKIFGPVIKAIEKVTGIEIQILAGKEAYINTVKDYNKLLCILEVYINIEENDINDYDKIFCPLSKELGIEKVRRACEKDAFLTARKDETFTDNLLRLLVNGDINYEAWEIFFESYYFTTRSSSMEAKVMDHLNSYTNYIEQYWQRAEQTMLDIYGISMGME